MPTALVVRRSSLRSVARGDDEIDSLFDASTLTSGVLVAWVICGSRISKSGNVEAVGRFAARSAIVRPNATTTAELVGAEFRFLYVALFEPGDYLLRQIVLDLAGICQKWHRIYEEHEFIVHRVDGWHLRELDGLVRERRSGREVQCLVWVSCEKFNDQDSVARYSHSQESTYEGTPGTEAGRPACAIPARSRPSIHGSERKHTPHK